MCIRDSKQFGDKLPKELSDCLVTLKKNCEA